MLLHLARFPRRRYMHGPTPIEKMERLSRELGGPTLYIKRDDLLMGLTAGGNKVRKLEFLVADALAQGADTLITTGAVQSNHCRLTLAAAVKEGLKCRLVLEERVPGSYDPKASGNNFLFELLNVEKIRVVPSSASLAEELEKEAADLRSEGRKPYIIPGGGSNPIGALGYVLCSLEICWQALELGMSFDYVVVASGSGGTHAGLLVGFEAMQSRVQVLGISVRFPKPEQEGRIHDLANRTAKLLRLNGNIPKQSVICFDDYVGPGYSLPTAEMVQAVRLVASKEGILLDPVYTGKAMAGLFDLIRRGYFRRTDNILFVHTGGWPALFAYLDVLRGSNQTLTDVSSHRV